ncbi:lipoate--protein ligase family protein [Deltaproteobacteria bacterium TL4]
MEFFDNGTLVSVLKAEVMEQQVWRLLQDLDKSGSFNMAADQVLLEQFHPGNPPTFRLYTWNRLTLSIGKNQNLDDDIDGDWCQANGIEIIRRATGGKAVLHGKDLTYALIGDTRDPRFSGGIMNTYKFISQGFVDFFEALGLAPQIQPYSPRPSQATPVCFARPSAFELLIDGKKIIGSAQRQTANAFLQHGTIPIQDQTALLAHIFPHSTAAELQKEVTSLEACGVLQNYKVPELLELLLEILQKVFQIRWAPSTWSAVEQNTIKHTLPLFEPLFVSQTRK